MLTQLESSTPPVQSIDTKWFVLHTKSRQEKALANDLEARGIEHFLPLISIVRYYGRRKFRTETPLFPGYLFLRGDLENVYEADRSDRVAGIIRVADQERLAQDIQNIEQTIDCGGSLMHVDPLRLGCWVEVKSGPFKGIVGQVGQEVTGDRLVLSVDMIGKAAVLEIDRSLLVPMT